MSPDAVYLGIIAAHLVMWPLATWQVPRRFVPTKRDEPDKMPSGGSVSCADATDSDAESLPTEPKDDIPRMKRQRWSNLSTTSAGQSESSYNSTLVVRAITLRIGWVMLLLALQLRFCSTSRILSCKFPFISNADCGQSTWPCGKMRLGTQTAWDCSSVTDSVVRDPASSVEHTARLTRG